MDPGLKLRQEFAAKQRSAMRGATLHQARSSFKGLVGGAVVGALSLGLTTVIMRLGAVWQSYLLEVALFGIMGWILARAGGGLMKGAFLMPAAFGAAHLVRQIGFDPVVLIGAESHPVSFPPLALLVALGCLIVCGGVLGHILENKI